MGQGRPTQGPLAVPQQDTSAPAMETPPPVPAQRGGLAVRSGRPPGSTTQPAPQQQEVELPYKYGAPYAMATNDAERTRVLREAYGADKVGRDSRGLYVTTPAGKKYPQSGLGADVTSQAAPVLGAAAGGIAGGAMSGGLAAVAGAGVGGAAGQAVNDAIMKSLGYTDRTAGSELGGLAESAAWSAGGEGVGRVGVQPLKTAAKYAGKSIGKFFDVDPQAAREAADMGAEGYRTHPESYAKSFPRAGREIALAERLGYAPLAKSAAKFGEEKTAAALEKTGLSADEAAADVAGMKTAAPSGETAGKALQDAARAEQTEAEAGHAEQVRAVREGAKETGKQAAVRADEAATAALKTQQDAEKDVDKTLTRGWESIDGLRKTSQPAKLAGMIAQKITELRAKVSNAHTQMYNLWDAKHGATEIDVSPIREAAADFLDDHAEELKRYAPSLVRSLGTLDQGPMTAGQLHNLRSQLRDLAYSPNLTPDIKKGTYKYLAGVVDQTLHENVLPWAARDLDRIDASYARNMKQFQNKTLQTMVDQIKDGLPPDASKIANMVIQPGETATLKRIQAIVGPAGTQKIAAADLSNVVAQAKYPLSDKIDPKRFLEQIDQRFRNGTLEVIYGKARADQISLLAQRLAARHGAFPIEGLTPDNFVAKLQTMNKAADAAAALVKANDPIAIMEAATKGGEKEVAALTEEFARRTGLSGDPLRALRNPDVLAANAAEEILHNDQRIEAAITRFGADSEPVTLLRRYALERMLAPIVRKEGAAATQAGLTGLSQKAQELLFPNGLLDDIKTINKGIEKIIGPSSRSAPSLATGAALDKPLLSPTDPFGKASRWTTQAKVDAFTWLVTHPKFARFMASDFVNGGPRGVAAVQKFQSIMGNLGRSAGALVRPESTPTEEGADEIPTQDRPNEADSAGLPDWRRYARTGTR